MSIAAKAIGMLRPKASARQIGPIGIDLSLEQLHMVQLESDGDHSTRVRARASVPYDCPRRELIERPHQFRSLLKRTMSADRFYGREAVLAMPPGFFRTVSINYKSTGGPDQEAAAVARVMKDRLDGDLNDYVIDYLPVKSRSKSEEHLALVAVSERQPVLDFLELARKAGLNVDALEIGPVAISRLVGTISTEQGNDNVLVINSGRKVSYLTLISRRDLLFDQELQIGENSLIEQVCSSLEMPEKMARDLVMRTGVHPGTSSDPVSEAINESGVINTLSEIMKPQFLILVEEIKRAFLYAAAETRGGAVSKVYLLGSIARWPGSDRLLSTLTGVDVAKIPDPLALFPATDTDASNANSAPEIAVATGLALRGMKTSG